MSCGFGLVGGSSDWRERLDCGGIGSQPEELACFPGYSGDHISLGNRTKCCGS